MGFHSIPTRLSELDKKEGLAFRICEGIASRPERTNMSSQKYLPMPTEAIKPGDVFLLSVTDTGKMKVRADHSPDDGAYWFCSKVDTSTGDTLVIVPATDLLELERDE